MYCLQVILCLMVISCHARDEISDSEQNVSPIPRVQIDMSRVLGSLVSRFYSNLPSIAAPEESQVQERRPSRSFLQEIKAGRHGNGPVHIYGRHISRGSDSSHKLSGASGRNRDHHKHHNIVDVL